MKYLLTFVMNFAKLRNLRPTVLSLLIKNHFLFHDVKASYYLTSMYIGYIHTHTYIFQEYEEPVYSYSTLSR